MNPVKPNAEIDATSAKLLAPKSPAVIELVAALEANHDAWTANNAALRQLLKRVAIATLTSQPRLCGTCREEILPGQHQVVVEHDGELDLVCSDCWREIIRAMPELAHPTEIPPTIREAEATRVPSAMKPDSEIDDASEQLLDPNSPTVIALVAALQANTDVQTENTRLLSLVLKQAAQPRPSGACGEEILPGQYQAVDKNGEKLDWIPPEWVDEAVRQAHASDWKLSRQR